MIEDIPFELTRAFLQGIQFGFFMAILPWGAAALLNMIEKKERQ